MNAPLFIARKLAFSRKKSFTAVVIRIAIAAIAVSVAVMLLTSALIDGFRAGISEKIFGFWGHIHISHVGVQSSLDNRPIPAHPDYFNQIDTLGRIGYYPDERAVAKGKQRITAGGIEYIQSYALLPGIIRTKENIEGIILKGAGPDFHWEKLTPFIREGRTPAIDSLQVSDEILISTITANRLKLKPEDQIIIHFIKDGEQLRRRFRISGIFKTGLDEYDQKLALVDIRKVTEILGWETDEVGGFEVFVEDLRDIRVFSDYIYSELLPAEIYAESIQSRFPQIFDWLELQRVNEKVVLFLMIIVSVINMITALLILILERTSMIGILNALGYGRNRIRQVFLIHAAYIIGMGLLFGNALGLGLGFIQDAFGIIRLDESSYYLSVAPIQFSVWKILAINAGTFLITLICLVLPSFLISRIDPVKAIKFK